MDSLSKLDRASIPPRLLSPIVDMLPAEYEARYYAQAAMAWANQSGLRSSRYGSLSLFPLFSELRSLSTFWMTLLVNKSRIFQHGSPAVLVFFHMMNLRVIPGHAAFTNRTGLPLLQIDQLPHLF